MADSSILTKTPVQIKCPSCGAGRMVFSYKTISHPIFEQTISAGETKCVNCRSDLAFAAYPDNTHTWRLYEEFAMSRYVVRTRPGFVYNSHVYMFYIYTPIQTEREWTRKAFRRMVAKFAEKRFNTVVVDLMADEVLASICDVYIRLPLETAPSWQLPYGSVLAEKMLSTYSSGVYGSAIVAAFPFFSGIFPEGSHIFHMKKGNDETPTFAGGVEFCANYFKHQVETMKSGAKLNEITIGVRI